MSSSSLIFIPSDFYQRIQEESVKFSVAILKTTIFTAWNNLRPYLPHIIGILFIFTVIAVFKAQMGRAGMLRGLLYNFFFFGAFGIIIWINGFEILFNTWFDIIYFLTYVACFKLVGLILPKSKRYGR